MMCDSGVYGADDFLAGENMFLNILPTTGFWSPNTYGNTYLLALLQTPGLYGDIASVYYWFDGLKEGSENRLS